MTSDIHANRILILDLGSPYTQLVARRVREAGVYSEVRTFDITEAELREFAPRGVILAGGAESTTGMDAPTAPSAVFSLGVPVLGICSGMQQAGAMEQHGTDRPIVAQIALTDAGRTGTLLQDMVDHQTSATSLLDVWMHGNHAVTALPEGFEVLARTEQGAIAAMGHDKHPWFELWFHPEVSQTLQGQRILERFLREICGCAALWTSANIIADALARVRKQVGNGKVLLGLSGGVDSSVVAALLHKAIGDQLTCVFVDHGLLRKDEAEQVMDMFARNMGVQVVRVDASAIFLERLKGVTDPEAKRKIIGNTFIEIFDEQAAQLEDVHFLAQGTIYPDVIESAAVKNGQVQVIKSHHNVGGLPEDMRMELVEPLRELFKDEVRKLGLELGLPYDMVYRHPFPGPGLGVRILGEVKKEYADILREADAIFIEELHKADWYHKTSQAFAVFLPIRSVGVVDDARRYEWVIALRAVETVDFMTARWAHLPYELLETVSHRIITEIPGISRVTYDVSSKPPATIEWE